MRRIALALLLLVLPAAFTTTVATPDDEATRRALTAQAAQWDRDIVAKHRAGVERNMAADFSQIRSNGAVVDRAAFIADILSDGLTIDPYTVEDFSVRLFGDAALLTGRVHLTGVENGEKFAAHFRYIDTYIKRDGHWQVVSVQLTPIKP